MIVNLTPHPVSIYPNDCPDGPGADGWTPMLTIPPHPTLPPARVGEISLGTVEWLYPRDPAAGQVAVEYVEYASHGGLVDPLPPQHPADRDNPRVWYLVSLVVALQQVYVYGRSDLLVAYREVRNGTGTVIGCRQLARPV